MGNLGKRLVGSIAICILFAALSGCGGGSGENAGAFSDKDLPVAEVGAIVPGSGQLLTSFDLSNLAPFLSPGVTYKVSIRAVSFSGLKSGFSTPATFVSGSSSKTLSWTPPNTYSDSTPLDPAADLEGYEIYVKES